MENVLLEKKERHDEGQLRTSQDSTLKPAQKPLISSVRKTAAPSVAPGELLYSYDRLVSPLFSDALDDFRTIIEQVIGEHRYSLSLRFEDSWDEPALKSDLMALSFALTLFRDGHIIQETRSRKFSLNLRQERGETGDPGHQAPLESSSPSATPTAKKAS